jgi:hypothetical protein
VFVNFKQIAVQLIKNNHFFCSVITTYFNLSSPQQPTATHISPQQPTATHISPHQATVAHSSLHQPAAAHNSPQLPAQFVLRYTSFYRFCMTAVNNDTFSQSLNTDCAV